MKPLIALPLLIVANMMMFCGGYIAGEVAAKARYAPLTTQPSGETLWVETKEGK